jgi:hypothetical protein
MRVVVSIKHGRVPYGMIRDCAWIHYFRGCYLQGSIRGTLINGVKSAVAKPLARGRKQAFLNKRLPWRMTLLISWSGAGQGFLSEEHGERQIRVETKGAKISSKI